MRDLYTVGRDDMSGELGLIHENIRQFDEMFAASTGDLVAHDLIEHVNGMEKIGSIGDELMALGGIWHTRGRHGDMWRNSQSIATPYEDMASDIANMGRDYVLGKKFNFPVPNTKPHIIDDDITDMFDCVKWQDNLEPDERNYQRESDYLKATRHFIRRGYNMQCKRFGTGSLSNTIYRVIEETVNKSMNWVEFEGQQFILNWSITNQTAYFDEYYEEIHA